MNLKDKLEKVAKYHWELETRLGNTDLPFIAWVNDVVENSDEWLEVI